VLCVLAAGVDDACSQRFDDVYRGRVLGYNGGGMLVDMILDDFMRGLGGV
jgi:hypothetical protein